MVEAERQVTLERNFNLAEKIRLCHSRIPEMRVITGFFDVGLVASLPIWSPVPEKQRKCIQDGWSITGLEAQNPKYLPEELKPFVRVKKGRHDVFLVLLEGAYKK
jgi:hypothetical protein